MRSERGPSYRVISLLADYEKFLEDNDHIVSLVCFIEIKKEKI